MLQIQASDVPAPDPLAAGEAKRRWPRMWVCFVCTYRTVPVHRCCSLDITVVRVDSAIGDANAIMLQSILRQFTDGGRNL